ncbi:hypothetical protein BCY84_22471 [Trypanosoma cruzi cruzi]|nr:hypothetical protein BCY84_22471 [Trypanosoma cruzi cruzi]
MVRDACLRAQDALRVCGVVWKYRWVTIRIQASSTDCEGSIKHCGFFWLCTTRLLDGAFVFNLLQLLWGRWEAEGMRMNSFVWLRSVELRPVVALFWGLAARLFCLLPTAARGGHWSEEHLFDGCELLTCVGHGVTNTSGWRVAVCRNDVRMTCGGCCL